jgi:ribosome-associated protein YbcJ (S4-like RNA binding protein)
MSKKHPGINQWKQHIQLGRRKPKPGESTTTKTSKPSNDSSDSRKPPGWRGRAAKAQDRRAAGAPSPTPAGPTHGKSPEVMIRPSKTNVERPLDGEGKPYITLVRFLKTVDAVGTGGAGKHAIRAGGILVNGVEELRPGRKLHAGDEVVVNETKHTVVL